MAVTDVATNPHPWHVVRPEAQQDKEHIDFLGTCICFCSECDTGKNCICSGCNALCGTHDR